MKIIRRFFLWLCCIAIFFYGAGIAVVSIYGLGITKKIIKRVSQKPIEVNSVGYQFPIGVVLRDISLKDDFTVSKLVIQINPRTFFSNDIYLYSVSLKQPVISIPKELLLKLDNRSLMISKLKIINGNIRYVDKELGNNLFVLSGLNLTLKDVTLPALDRDMPYKLTSNLSFDKVFINNQYFISDGWLNIADKNMAAKIKINHWDRMAVLSADVVSKNNVLDVTADVSAREILQTVQKKGLFEKKSQDQSLFSKLSTLDADVMVQFLFRTKMDQPTIEKIKFKGSVDTKNLDE